MSTSDAPGVSTADPTAPSPTASPSASPTARSADFEALRRRLADAGCFTYRPLGSVVSLGVHVLLSGALFVASANTPVWAAVPLFAAASFLFHRIGWLMHDAAHGGVFAEPSRNRAFAWLCAGILGELPSGWRYGHARHHAAPNVVGRDLDQAERWDPTRRYRTLPGAFVGLLLFSKFKGVYLPKTTILLGLRDGWFCHRHARSRFPKEAAVALSSVILQGAVLVALFGAWGPVLLFAHTWIGLVYLNAVFAGSHYDLDRFEPDAAAQIDFAELQIRTTRNYTPGALAAFVFGGIEYQIEHHLFPHMPRHAFPRAAAEVRAFCAARGLPYRVTPFGEAIRAALRFHVGAGVKSGHGRG